MTLAATNSEGSSDRIHGESAAVRSRNHGDRAGRLRIINCTKRDTRADDLPVRDDEASWVILTRGRKAAANRARGVAATPIARP